MRHIHCSPYHPSWNGLVEHFVQPFKQAMTASANSDKILQHHVANFLFTYHMILIEHHVWCFLIKAYDLHLICLNLTLKIELCESKLTNKTSWLPFYRKEIDCRTKCNGTKLLPRRQMGTRNYYVFRPLTYLIKGNKEYVGNATLTISENGTVAVNLTMLQMMQSWCCHHKPEQKNHVSFKKN